MSEEEEVLNDQGTNGRTDMGTYDSLSSIFSFTVAHYNKEKNFLYLIFIPLVSTKTLPLRLYNNKVLAGVYKRTSRPFYYKRI